jgi:hypothetical protein
MGYIDDNLNSMIEEIFQDFVVDGVSIPVSYLVYEGHNDTYITYLSYDKDNSYSSDDNISGYAVYYDFDIYSKSNYCEIIKEIKQKMADAGWTYQPRRESPDQYEKDTRLYHKTLCFSYPVQEQELSDEQ